MAEQEQTRASAAVEMVAPVEWSIATEKAGADEGAAVLAVAAEDSSSLSADEGSENGEQQRKDFVPSHGLTTAGKYGHG